VLILTLILDWIKGDKAHNANAQAGGVGIESVVIDVEAAAK
jgi:hypothetical protein